MERDRPRRDRPVGGRSRRGRTSTTWRPAAALRLARRRTWGQVLAAAATIYVRRARVFLGIGLLFIPLGFGLAVVQVLLGGFGLLGIDVTGESAGVLVLSSSPPARR